MRRKLQVDDAAVLEPHDHVIWQGEDEADLYALAGTALAAGARRGEKLMFVAQHPDLARLREVPDLDRLVGSDQLELVEIDAVYGDSGDFDEQRQLATFEGVLADALSEGYTGIRVVADNTRLASGDEQGFRRWLRWEQVTDRFQCTSAVTGVCYFDRAALSEERMADLASVHPVRSANSAEPVFSFVVDGDAVSVGGTLDTWSADQLQRILDTAPDDRPLIVDLSEAEFVDHHAVLALESAASASRPVQIRRARPIIHELVSLLKIPSTHLSIE